MGHRADRRGELQPVLRQRRPRAGGAEAATCTRYGVAPPRVPAGSRVRPGRRALRPGQAPQRGHRFGWVVEIDPFDPDSTPRKRTALGRFKHEAATTALTKDGRLVVYMGDDERFDYLYKFVSEADAARAARGAARSTTCTLLDEGTLYVAKFTGDCPGRGDRRLGQAPRRRRVRRHRRVDPAGRPAQSYVDGMTADEVLVFTRVAGDKVGRDQDGPPRGRRADPRHRRASTWPSPTTPTAARRQARRDEANPRNANKHGQILELTETARRRGGRRVRLVAAARLRRPERPGDLLRGLRQGQGRRRSPARTTSPSTPTATCGSPPTATQLGSNDGLFAMPVTRPRSAGTLRQFLTVPRGAETCGPWSPATSAASSSPCSTRARSTGASPEKPASNWPDGGTASLAPPSPSSGTNRARRSAPDRSPLAQGEGLAWTRAPAGRCGSSAGCAMRVRDSTERPG